MSVRLKYVSKGGTVKMNGPFCDIQIIALSGFEMPSKAYDTIEFAGENGVTTTGSKDMARTITISGDIYGDQKKIAAMVKAFYYEGTLYCEFGNVRRKIGCKVINMEDVERQGQSGISRFVVQFQADYPYFNDFNDTIQPISQKEDLVSGEFVLPCLWTKICQSGVARNTGDKVMFPIIEITASNNTESETADIVITNQTTGAYIKLNYIMQQGEVVTLDLNTRRIKSSINGNITNKISDDTILSNFFLDLGDNEIAFETTADNQLLTATVNYNRIYLMAVR